MTYIPVDARVTYTAQIHTSVFDIFGTLSGVISKLKQDLQYNLPGYEEFDIENSSGTSATFGNPTISLVVRNAGVDHGSEDDVKSIIDGVLIQEGVTVVSSNITQIQQPLDPQSDNSGQVTSTGALAINAPPSTNNSSPISTLTSALGLGSLTTGTKLLGTTTIIIIAVVALVLIFPSGFIKLIKGGR